MRIRNLVTVLTLVVGPLLVLSACDDNDVTGPSANIDGTWDLSVNVGNTALGATCVGTGIVDLSQSGNTFDGQISGSAIACTGPFGQIDGDLDGPFTGGHVQGTRVTYSDGVCSYDGTASGQPADRISGTATCQVPVNTGTVTFTGTFLATR